MDILEALSRYFQTGDACMVVQMVRHALKQGYPPEEILKRLLAEIEIISEKFKKNEVYIPHILLAARAMNAGLDVIRASLSTVNHSFGAGRAIIGTVKGDLHDLGKNMVKAMLEKEGFLVYDIGRDVPEEEYVRATLKFRPHVLALSATMTSTVNGIKDVIRALEKAKVRDQLIIMVGGLPVTEAFAKDAGADIYAVDPGKAAELARKRYLLNKSALLRSGGGAAS